MKGFTETRSTLIRDRTNSPASGTILPDPTVSMGIIDNTGAVVIYQDTRVTDDVNSRAIVVSQPPRATDDIARTPPKADHY